MNSLSTKIVQKTYNHILVELSKGCQLLKKTIIAHEGVGVYDTHILLVIMPLYHFGHVKRKIINWAKNIEYYILCGPYKKIIEKT